MNNRNCRGESNIGTKSYALFRDRSYILLTERKWIDLEGLGSWGLWAREPETKALLHLGSGRGILLSVTYCKL